MFTRRGNVSIITFSLMISLYFLIFLSSYIYYSNEVDSFENKIHKVEVINSLYSIRSSLVELISVTNNTLNYTDYSNVGLSKFVLDSSYIYGSIYSEKEVIELNISTLGVDFCSRYIVDSNLQINFYFNGSCILVI